MPLGFALLVMRSSGGMLESNAAQGWEVVVGSRLIDDIDSALPWTTDSEQPIMITHFEFLSAIWALQMLSHVIKLRVA